MSSTDGELARRDPAARLRDGERGEVAALTRGCSPCGAARKRRGRRNAATPATTSLLLNASRLMPHPRFGIRIDERPGCG